MRTGNGCCLLGTKATVSSASAGRSSPPPTGEAELWSFQLLKGKILWVGYFPMNQNSLPKDLGKDFWSNSYCREQRRGFGWPKLMEKFKGCLQGPFLLPFPSNIYPSSLFYEQNASFALLSLALNDSFPSLVKVTVTKRRTFCPIYQ